MVCPSRLYTLGATAGLPSSAGSTVGQANRGTRKLNMDRPLELFARERVEGWTQWGDEVDSYKAPDYPMYNGHVRRLDRSIQSQAQPAIMGTRQRRLRLLSE